MLLFDMGANTNTEREEQPGPAVVHGNRPFDHRSIVGSLMVASGQPNGGPGASSRFPIPC